MRNDNSKPVPTRFSEEELARVDATAKGIGLGRSSFIRFCVNMFVRAYERGGRDVLPGNWEEIVRSLDNCTREGNGARWKKKAP